MTQTKTTDSVKKEEPKTAVTPAPKKSDAEVIASCEALDRGTFVINS